MYQKWLTFLVFFSSVHDIEAIEVNKLTYQLSDLRVIVCFLAGIQTSVLHKFTIIIVTYIMGHPVN